MAVLFRDTFSTDASPLYWAEEPVGAMYGAAPGWYALQGVGFPNSGGMLGLLRVTGDFTITYRTIYRRGFGQIQIDLDAVYPQGGIYANLNLGDVFTYRSSGYSDLVVTSVGPINGWSPAATFPPMQAMDVVDITVVGRQAEASVEVFFGEQSIVKVTSRQAWDDFTTRSGGAMPGLAGHNDGTGAPINLDFVEMVEGAHPPGGGGVDPEPVPLTASGSVGFSGSAALSTPPPPGPGLTASGSVGLSGSAALSVTAPVVPMTASGSVGFSGSAALIADLTVDVEAEVEFVLEHSVGVQVLAPAPAEDFGGASYLTLSHEVDVRGRNPHPPDPDDLSIVRLPRISRFWKVAD